MRLFSLYLRTRRTRHSIAYILLLAAVVGLSFAWSNPGALMVLILTLMPAAIANILGLSVTNPFGDLEQIASHPLAVLRLGHLAGLVLAAVLALTIAGIATTAPAIWLVLVRNTLGYAGLALIAATRLSPAYFWLVPVLYGGMVFAGSSEALWAWPLRPSGDAAAGAVAGGLLLLGLMIVANRDRGLRPGNMGAQE